LVEICVLDSENVPTCIDEIFWL